MRCPNSVDNCVFVHKKLVSERSNELSMSHYTLNTKSRSRRERTPESPLAGGGSAKQVAAHSPMEIPLFLTAYLTVTTLPDLSNFSFMEERPTRMLTVTLVRSVFSLGRKQMAACLRDDLTQDISHNGSLLVALKTDLPERLPARWEV